jgi:hypothetical protein
MNLNSIILTILLFDSALVILPAINPFGPNLPTPTLLPSITYGINYIQTAINNFNNIANAAQCTGTYQQNTPQLQCSNNPLGLVGVIFWQTVTTFGDFLWGVITLIPTYAFYVVMPYFTLTALNVPVAIASLYQLVTTFLFVLWIYVLITGRYNAEVT